MTGELFCTVCNTLFTSQKHWDDHVVGQKHLRAIANTLSQPDDPDGDIVYASNIQLFNHIYIKRVSHNFYYLIWKLLDRMGVMNVECAQIVGALGLFHWEIM